MIHRMRYDDTTMNGWEWEEDDVMCWSREKNSRWWAHGWIDCSYQRCFKVWRSDSKQWRCCLRRMEKRTVITQTMLLTYYEPTMDGGCIWMSDDGQWRWTTTGWSSSMLELDEDWSEARSRYFYNPNITFSKQGLTWQIYAAFDIDTPVGCRLNT